MRHRSPIGARVLAYGSNASPAQLARKYRDATCSVVIPMTRGWARNLAVGYSDHETRYGAVPATPVMSSGVCTEVFVAWLDPEQLIDLDRSEARNYERRPFDLGVHELYVADGPQPIEVDVYVSTRGVFTHDRVTPGVAGIDTTYRAGPLLTQTEVRRLRTARDQSTNESESAKSSSTSVIQRSSRSPAEASSVSTPSRRNLALISVRISSSGSKST